MYRLRVVFLLTFLDGCLLVLAITNNADLIWYEKDSEEPHNYFARQPIPEGLIKSQKIVVNQKLPLIWEVKFAFFDNLESLVIDGCGVNEIRPGALKDLKPLTNLSLTRNNIKEIKEGVFNFVQIQNLNFSHNKISILARQAFDNMPALQTVVLDYNELKHWNSDWFLNCTNIKTVSVTHNFLKEIPEKAFKNFRTQQGSEVDVYFSYNKIKAIDSDAFEDAQSFGDLFLDWNELEEIDDDAFGKLPSVKNLNLDGNSIQCLTIVAGNVVLNKTTFLSIKENPFECECLKELRVWVKNNKKRVQLSEQSTEC